MKRGTLYQSIWWSKKSSHLLTIVKDLLENKSSSFVFCRNARQIVFVPEKIILMYFVMLGFQREFKGDENCRQMQEDCLDWSVFSLGTNMRLLISALVNKSDAEEENLDETKNINKRRKINCAQFYELIIRQSFCVKRKIQIFSRITQQQRRTKSEFFATTHKVRQWKEFD